jgi:hypothetical protein
MEDLSREQVEGFLMDVQEYLGKEGIEVLEVPGRSPKGRQNNPERSLPAGTRSPPTIQFGCT